MTAPVRERLLAAITTAVDGVYRETPPEDERDLPITYVQDGADEVTADYDYTRLSMEVGVGRAEPADAQDRESRRAQAHDILADIVTAMYADETFGALAQGLQMASCGIQTELGKFVFATASFKVQYQHVRGDPRALDLA